MPIEDMICVGSVLLIVVSILWLPNLIVASMAFALGFYGFCFLFGDKKHATR